MSKRSSTSGPYSPTKMRRARVIFILTHGYALFIALHLYFGDWCKLCQLIFNIVPIIVFGGLLLIWSNSGRNSLTKFEQYCIRYLVINILFISLYYCLCVFSSTAWIYNRNIQAGAFVLITLIFYSLNHYKRE